MPNFKHSGRFLPKLLFHLYHNFCLSLHLFLFLYHLNCLCFFWVFCPAWPICLIRFKGSCLSQTKAPGNSFLQSSFLYFLINIFGFFFSVHCVPQGGAPLKHPTSKFITQSELPFSTYKKYHTSRAIHFNASLSLQQRPPPLRKALPSHPHRSLLFPPSLVPRHVPAERVVWQHNEESGS